jgi:hypothetical protein
MRLRLMLLICLALNGVNLQICVSAQQSSNPLPSHALTNQDIIRMTKANFGDATILKMIETHTGYFDLSVDALLRLQELGVSLPVIQAMLSAGASSQQVLSPAPKSAPVPAKAADLALLPDEVGVYQVVKEKLVAIEPEIVNWRTGGVIKNAVTLGLDKGHVNGTVSGPRSRTDVAASPLGMAGPVQFYIRCLEGNSASEYQLLHFWTKADRREFRSVTGGVLHASGGAENNVVAFKFEKVAPRTYRVELPAVGFGEYGFLAPGAAASSDMASRGKVYTFRIIE